MRVLYGVNGEGMGHATRSQVVIDHLLERHDVRVVASGAAYRYLSERLPKVKQVFGPTFAMGDGQIQRFQTVVQTARHARNELPAALRLWVAEVRDWRPEVVITDFEPLAALFARVTRTPLVAVDNINMLDRCRHDRHILAHEREDFLLARGVVRRMVPGAVDYIVLTFFRPPLARRRTTLVPPIVRPEVAGATSVSGDHLVVYSSGERQLLDALRATGMRCLVYGMRGGPEKAVVDGKLELRPPSAEGFVEALRTARAVVTGGGFSLLSEAVYLRKPVLSVPLHGQFEQVLNARYLDRLGYGMNAPEVTPAALDRFLARLPDYERQLAGYDQRGNAVALRRIEESTLAAAGAPPRELRSERRAARSAGR